LCLAAIGKIIKIEGKDAIIDYGGITKNANISFVDVSIDDYVLVHAGFAIQKVLKEDFDRNNDLFRDGF